MSDKKVFDQFTNQYALSKTLRFELKPVGSTREKMNENLKYNPVLKTFLKDQDIEDAYQALKPVFDKLHEDFITHSLQTIEAKNLVFSEYFELYKKYRVEKDKEEKRKIEKVFDTIEKELRKKFESIYQAEGELFKKKVGKNEKNKEILKEKSYKVLTEAGILKYIKNNIKYFVGLGLKTREGKQVTTEDLEKALGTSTFKGIFDGFFTYFNGFNQNRENYYAIDEKSTAVATRIVNENLPKFCDNIFNFYSRELEYLNVYDYLNNKENALKGKNSKGEEKFLEPISKDVFDIAHFNYCLSQKEIEEYNIKIGDANYLINLYNQLQENKAKKLKLFKTLYKQIGCGEQVEFIQSIKSSEEFKNTLKIVLKESKVYFKKVYDFFHYLKAHENFEHIYWSDKAINTISSKYFANWYTVKADIWGKRDKKGNLKDEEVKIPKAVQLKDLFEVLDKTENWEKKGVLFRDALFEKDSNEKFDIIKKSQQPSIALVEMIFSDVSKHIDNFESVTEQIFEINDEKTDENRQIIKQWFDALLFTNQIVKYWKVKDKFPTESGLVQKLEDILFPEEGNNPVRFYDLVRNYLTGKPQDEINKLKLNFENGQLLGGWSDGQEKNKGAVILKKEDKYFIGILKKKNIFDTEEKDNVIYNKNGDAGRLILMNLKFQTLAGKGFLKDNNNESYGDMGKRDPQRAIKALQKLIVDRNYATKYPKLKKIAEKLYTDKKIFDKEIQDTLKDCYVCEFKKINWSAIEQCINLGELFVFEIRCRSKAMQNWYWKEVFKENSSAQLLGGAEIFYRPVVIKDDNKVKLGYEDKKDKNGKNYIIENKRFTEEKFLFYCPIKINYKQKNYGKPQYAVNEVNININKIIKENTDITFLGIDRGEKHLAYYSLINQTGEILKQGSFNIIKDENTGKEHDYAEKLAKKAGERDEARKNWTTIENIKELKDGYISQVVRKIVDLAIENNAFIVLENLNVGFKRGRQKIEKQVYQKLELALAKKLNFVVDKDAKEGNVGSVSKALQLTPPVNNFGDIEGRSQFGIMLYTKADYTSQTDPVTGWRKSIYLKKGSADIQKQIIDSFDDFGFDGTDYYFTYTDKVTQKKVTLYSGKNGESHDRYYRELVFENSDKQWIPKKQDIVERLNKIFENFDFNKNQSAKNQILEGDRIDLQKCSNKDQNAWESLRFTIDLIQQIRNTGTEKKDEDFILSPVRDQQGNHFDSRKVSNHLPNSGDANGAYNIARKGIIMAKHIEEGWNLFISDDEWSAWLAGKDVWCEWVSKNEKLLKKK